ncbi:DUF4238 domain-containing protein [Shewanella pneumatophori]|uniref:DUF4238 domain-containing protein n=1 Tax=Shewanella pneumatophori TaxID=314092 RepID=A0A9X1ZLK4_9GAMM|nr:DUF4238 domain-containing protein [Shewanella pneumatophori]MCL1140128.1 DUF4238 domain-containing protein [Shewanella pneumatophori]
MAEISKKSLEATKNNHYVWAYYMKRWSPDNKQVFYTSKKNKKTAFDSVKNVAVERDFYRVEYLTPTHIEAIKSFSKESPQELHKQHMFYLSDFLLMQNLEARYQQVNKKDDTTDKMLEAWRSNGIERLHSAHEKEVQIIITALAEHDLSVLNDNNNMCFFMQFLAQQITRTKTFKSKVLTSLSNNAATEKEKHLANAMKECWWFISYMFGMNIGSSIFLDRYNDNHCLLINNTEISFITSDQPVINVHLAVTDEIKPPKEHECDLYYPISPTVAYMVNKSNRFPRGKVQVSVDIVEEMNIKIAKQANVHIIGNSEESLKAYKKYVGINLEKVKNT